jgi:hypothetical protein
VVSCDLSPTWSCGAQWNSALLPGTVFMAAYIRRRHGTTPEAANRDERQTAGHQRFPDRRLVMASYREQRHFA